LIFKELYYIFLIMEKRLSIKANAYVDDFKEAILKKLENITTDTEKLELCEYIKTYKDISFDKDDFTKRKRNKNSTPLFLRCCARRANGDQCTRKRKEGITFCGTHDKNRPHGIISETSTNNLDYEKREIWLQEINGVIYYIDNFNNVYDTYEIINNKTNPNVIFKYKLENNDYKLVDK